MSRSKSQTDESSHLDGRSTGPLLEINQVTDETRIVEKPPLHDEASATSTSRAPEQSRDEYGSSSLHPGYGTLGRGLREMEEPLPIYSTDDAGHDSLQNALASVLTFGRGGAVLDLEALRKVTESQQRVAANAKEAEEIVPVLHYPMVPGKPFAASDEVTRAQQTIVNAFFNAIERNKSELVALFIDNHLVVANTTDWRGRTPLLAAVSTGHIRMVQELIDFGADADAFGVEVIEIS